MPRPIKCRKVCQLPRKKEFLPEGGCEKVIVLTVDEFETVRLIDQKHLSQEECANYMQVARTTAQQIYNSARFKIANALVEGVGLRIEGGEYRLCSGGEELSECKSCCRRRKKECGGCNQDENYGIE